MFTFFTLFPHLQSIRYVLDVHDETEIEDNFLPEIFEEIDPGKEAPEPLAPFLHRIIASDTPVAPFHLLKELDFDMWDLHDTTFIKWRFPQDYPYYPDTKRFLLQCNHVESVDLKLHMELEFATEEAWCEMIAKCWKQVKVLGITTSIYEYGWNTIQETCGEQLRAVTIHVGKRWPSDLLNTLVRIPTHCPDVERLHIHRTQYNNEQPAEEWKHEILANWSEAMITRCRLTVSDEATFPIGKVL